MAGIESMFSSKACLEEGKMFNAVCAVACVELLIGNRNVAEMDCW